MPLFFYFSQCTLFHIVYMKNLTNMIIIIIIIIIIVIIIIKVKIIIVKLEIRKSQDKS